MSWKRPSEREWRSARLARTARRATRLARRSAARSSRRRPAPGRGGLRAAEASVEPSRPRRELMSYAEVLWHLDDQAICEKSCEELHKSKSEINERASRRPPPPDVLRSLGTHRSPNPAKRGRRRATGSGGEAPRSTAPPPAPPPRAPRRAAAPRAGHPTPGGDAPPLSAPRARRRTRAAGRCFRRCARSASRPSWASRGPTSVRSRTPCPTRRRATRRRTTGTTPTRMRRTRVRSSTLTSATWTGTRRRIAP